MKKILVFIFIFTSIFVLSSCKGSNRKIYETYEYGEYPQSKVYDSKIITELDKFTSADVNEDGYFILNGKKYLKAYAELDSDSSRFADDSKIVKGNYYYFQVSPIRWRVLNKNNNEMQLITESVLISSNYTNAVDSLDYSSSLVRSFLITDFYNRAFKYTTTKPLTKNIVITTIDDKKISEINDSIWIPTTTELQSQDNGFYSSDDRYAFVTDYAKAMGINYCKEGATSYFNNAANFITSTLSLDSKSIFYCDFYGDYKMTSDLSSLTKIGVRPRIDLKIQ